MRNPKIKLNPHNTVITKYALGLLWNTSAHSKKLNSDKTEVNLYQVIQEVFIERKIRNVEFYYEDIKKLPNVEANYGLLKEVFGELVLNALKSIKDDGKILISGRKVSSKLIEIYVKDTGCGIPQENLDIIFASPNEIVNAMDLLINKCLTVHLLPEVTDIDTFNDLLTVKTIIQLLERSQSKLKYYVPQFTFKLLSSLDESIWDDNESK